jgi:hypothetical protein
MGQIAKRVEDKWLLKLIRAFLNAGVMENGLVSASFRREHRARSWSGGTVVRRTERRPRGGGRRRRPSRRLATRARAVVECSHRPFDHSPFDAPLDGLMLQSERPTYRKKRRVLTISQQCAARAWRRPPLQRDAVLILQQKTKPSAIRALPRIR